MLPILRVVAVGGVLLAITMLLLAAKPPGGSHPPLTRAMAPARGALITRDDHPEWRQLLIKAALRRADELNQLRALPDDPPAPHLNDDAKPDPDTAPADQSEAAAGDAEASVAETPDEEIPPVIGDISPMHQRVAALPADQNEANPGEVATGDTEVSVADVPDNIMPPDVGEIAPFAPRVAALPADRRDATVADLNVAAPTEDEVTGSIAAAPPIGPPVPLPRKRPTDLNATQRAEPAAQPSRRARRAQATAQAPQQIDFFQALFGVPANRQGINQSTAGDNNSAAPP